MRTDTPTLIRAMHQLADQLLDDDIVASSLTAEAADRLEEQAATLAKLPRYHDTGEAFVPEVDDCWVWWGNQPAKIAPCRDNGRWCVYDRTRFYPTAAECEEAQGKSVIAYAKADHIAAGQAVTKRLRDDGTAATPRGEEVGNAD